MFKIGGCGCLCNGFLFLLVLKSDLVKDSTPGQSMWGGDTISCQLVPRYVYLFTYYTRQTFQAVEIDGSS